MFCFFPHQDKDVTEASGHVVDLTGRLRELETSLTESRSRENKLLKDLEENKRRYREAKHWITQLKGTWLKLHDTKQWALFKKWKDFKSVTCTIKLFYWVRLKTRPADFLFHGVNMEYFDLNM